MVEDLQQVYQAAIASHEQGRVDQAVVLYEQILAVHPDADLVLYNHGLALFALGRFAEAVESFLKARDARPEDADVWFNLAMALKHDTRYEEAACAYEQALALQPEQPDIIYNLANCHREAGEFEQAGHWYDTLLGLDPNHLSALNNFGYLCHRQGNYSRAESLYRKLLRLEPEHAGAKHMLAALTGAATDTPEQVYVRDLFDQYSATFEQELVERLDYRVPQLLYDLCLEGTGAAHFTNCLDLGCGTGLAGALFRQCCDRLAGVDLSAGMVEVARDKGLYDFLAVDDVICFLGQATNRYDLFVAADVLTYMGDLSPLFSVLAGNGVPECRFVFSTEHGDGNAWVVRPTGRFAHDPGYVAYLVIQLGGRLICTKPARLRKEAGQWIAGDLYLVAF